MRKLAKAGDQPRARAPPVAATLPAYRGTWQRSCFALVFPGGKIEPGETPAEAAVREVAEETGLSVHAGSEIGRRIHPATRRSVTYLACYLTGDAAPAQAAPREVAEVRGVNLVELDELMPDLYRPVSI